MYIITNALYKSDISKIEKLNKLNNINTFWNDVRKLTKKVYSDFSISRWQCLAEMRYKELGNKILEVN